MKLPHYRVTWFVNEMAKLSKDFATVVEATHFAEKKVASESSVDYANVYRVEKSADDDRARLSRPIRLSLVYTEETLLYEFKRMPAHLARVSTRGWTDAQLLDLFNWFLRDGTVEMTSWLQRQAPHLMDRFADLEDDHGSK
jgi:hypothetical protein